MKIASFHPQLDNFAVIDVPPLDDEISAMIDHYKQSIWLLNYFFFLEVVLIRVIINKLFSRQIIGVVLVLRCDSDSNSSRQWVVLIEFIVFF